MKRMKMNENTMKQIAVLEEHNHLGPAGLNFQNRNTEKWSLMKKLCKNNTVTLVFSGLCEGLDFLNLFFKFIF